jgi:hypothetical protein
MKKKIAVIGTALFVFASVEAFSFGVGLRGNFGYGNIGGGAILFSPNSTTHFGVSYYVGDNVFYIGGTGDIWLFEKALANLGRNGTLDFYAGPGIFVQMSRSDDNDFGFGLGLRIPAGLDLNFRVFDLFLEFAPQIGVSFMPSPDLYGRWFDAAIGFRFWLGR